ncbi:MAG: M48 family metallopeptidase [Ruminococcaceae bacterium]|nr:M48 family metallopeptidase [Oscillospiraceae bacterium]
MNQPVKQKYFRYGGALYPYELHIGGVKRLNLRIRSDGSIRLSVPRATSQRQIDAFLVRCGDKIADAVARIQANKSAPKPELPAAEQRAKKEQLLAIIQACHRNVILPRFAALNLPMTEEQRQFITSPTAIRIHPMKSRWGSCNVKKGTLNFNLYLIDQLPECIEYVVMHEFAHFVQPDHSPAYHALMTALMPDWKGRKAKLNAKN